MGEEAWLQWQGWTEVMQPALEGAQAFGIPEWLACFVSEVFVAVWFLCGCGLLL